MLGLIKKIFGTAQSRQLKRYRKTVKQINAIEKAYQKLSESELKQKVAGLRKRLNENETLDDLLPEAYALVKNACRRLVGTEIHVSGYHQKWDMIPYDVQLIGAIALHHGCIAEMQTGEGKTLTASMPLFLNALAGKPVHLVTVNDYLAARDCAWVGEIYRYLGLTVKALTNETSPYERKDVYAADIVYGTASEFGFDYLRDNSMAQTMDSQCQRGFFYAIIDEVDSILIDEARTPLIISGPAAASKQMYGELQQPVAQIVRLQRDLCTKTATEARQILTQLGCFHTNEGEPLKKLSKKEGNEAATAYRKLWLVSKGMPHNKILKRIRQHPDMRAEIDKWETYFYAEPNKEERHEALAKLYIIIDERAQEFELTDKGIQKWSDAEGNSAEDFIMLDLGHEYAKIDCQDELSEQQKMERKVTLREEDSNRKERAHNLRQLLRAHLLMERDIDYIIQDKKIVIIDENTGRPQPGRRFSDGLHQSIEAKENVPIQKETQTYATITLQNFFRMYDKLAGMTGTAMTEANEFKEIYQLETLEIPTHRPCIRKDGDDQIYMTEREKYNALIRDIVALHNQGRPILIGTESVEISEKLARILRQNQLPHQVLNAKNHAHEAEIISHAGKRGAITVATNMAGRGTDIKLEAGVAELGGLHVIGTSRHQSRRIDRQLRGRCARQGDPGSSQFYISFEDTLMRLFASPKLTAMLQRFRPPEGEPISAKILNRSIETAQKRVEQRNYSIRKHTLEYDNVMNKQRQEIYLFRNEVLKQQKGSAIAEEILDGICRQKAEEFFIARSSDSNWNPQGYCTFLMTHFPVTFEEGSFDDDYLAREEIETAASEKICLAFKEKMKRQTDIISTVQQGAQREIDPAAPLEQIIQSILLRNIDHLWQEHLLSIDHLRTEVTLRVIGQKDPLMEFKTDAFALFDHFSQQLKLNIGHDLFRFEMLPADSTQELHQSIQKMQKKRASKPTFSKQDPDSELYLRSKPINTAKKGAAKKG
ncbi:MAG: preprotein translocase subunit SecA [Chlamydiota bacterium]